MIPPLLLAIAALTQAQALADGLARYEFQSPLMGTTFHIVLYCDDATRAQVAADEAFRRAEVLNGLLSDYDDQSEVRRLCDSAPHAGPVAVSPELWTVLACAIEVSRQSKGAFDVTVGPLVRLWRQARRTERLPSQERLREARASVGWRLVEMHPKTQAVRLPLAGMRIDLGGIAKGYAADACLETLRAHGIDRALVDAGGDVVAGEAPPGSEGWRIAVASMDSATTGYLILRHGAVATSGDTWQFVEIQGLRYSHLVNPRTGMAVTQRRLVNVAAPTGMLADAWASALSVLGPGAPLNMLSRRAGFEARVVTLDEKGCERALFTRRWSSLLAPKVDASASETELPCEDG